jgi:hypothetical protein
VALEHVVATAVLPFHYGDRYRTLVSETFYSDGVSAGLVAAGLNPIHVLLAPALLLGAIAAWRSRRQPATLFLLCLLAVGTLTLGIAGPSLTRLLILLPAYLVLAALGIGLVSRWMPRARIVVAVALATILVTHGPAYFTRLPRTPQSVGYVSPVATPMGKRAREIARTGQQVVCVLSANANVVWYLAHDVAQNVSVVEFHRRPFAAEEVPLPEPRPAVLLIETAAPFATFLATFPREWRVVSDPGFVEVRLRGE